MLPGLILLHLPASRNCSRVQKLVHISFLFCSYISIGLVDENTVGDPIASWTDPTPYTGIDTMGLTAVGSAIFYKYQCGFGSTFPDGICASDSACEHLANTRCQPRALGESNETAIFQSCQCLPGYQVIPSKWQISQVWRPS